LNNILPGDGKRKKAVVKQTHFHAPMKRRLGFSEPPFLFVYPKPTTT